MNGQPCTPLATGCLPTLWPRQPLRLHFPLPRVQANVTCGDTTIGYVALVTTDGGSYWNVSFGGPGSRTLCTCAEHGAPWCSWDNLPCGTAAEDAFHPPHLPPQGSCRGAAAAAHINTTRVNPFLCQVEDSSVDFVSQGGKVTPGLTVTQGADLLVRARRICLPK